MVALTMVVFPSPSAIISDKVPYFGKDIAALKNDGLVTKLFYLFLPS